jgi:hypothetical protein
MFHQTDFDPDAALSSDNRVRVSEGLEPYRAPSGWSQFVSAIVLALVVSILLLLVS